MLTRVLVLVRRADHRVAVLLRRERHRPADAGSCADDRLDDLARRLIDDLVVVRLEPDPDLLPRAFCHLSIPARLLDDLDHPAGADGAATFPDGETETLV